MFRGLTSEHSIRPQISRRAMLETLMRHLQMVRLSVGVSLAIVFVSVGCTGLIGESGTSGTQATPEQQVAQQKWTSEALPVFVDNCVACHGGSTPSENFLQATSDDGIRTQLLGWTPQVVDIGAPSSSRVLVKGAHEGPALGATDSAAILDWLGSEQDAAAGSSSTPILETPKFTPLLCTGGTPGDTSECNTGDANQDGVIACCPINRVPLDSFSLVGAEIDFVAQPLATDTYITDLYLKASTDGVYLEHPLFSSWPTMGDPIPDGLDRFFDVKLNLAQATAAVTCPPIGPSCDHIGAGAAAFVGFPPQNQLSIAFQVIEAYHPDATQPPATVGCATMGFASFLANVKPLLTTGTQPCNSCHGGQNTGATAAMDLTGIASTTDNTTCLQVRNHITTTGTTPSPILLAPEAGQDATHPLKLSTTSNPTYTNFSSGLDTWIAVEVTGM